MNILAIDTSGECISLCALKNKRIVFKYSRRKKHGASSVITYLDALLKKHSLKLRDFDVFLVGRGPGSFTGLRIAFSIVKAFGLALKRNVFAVDSFASIAYQAKDKSSRIAVISDARRDLVYAQSFKVTKDKLTSEKRVVLCKAHQFVSGHKEYLFLTPDEALRNKLEQEFSSITFYKTCVCPRAESLIMLFKEGYPCIQSEKKKIFEPLYVYPDDCQVKKI